MDISDVQLGQHGGRGNRTSFYVFNLAGGLGAGSYVQEAVAQGTWYHNVAVVDRSTDTIKWYKNGVLQDQDPFIASEYRINPRNGTAPVRGHAGSVSGTLNAGRCWPGTVTSGPIEPKVGTKRPLCCLAPIRYTMPSTAGRVLGGQR